MNTEGKRAPTRAEELHAALLNKAYKQGRYAKAWSKNPYSRETQTELYNAWKDGRVNKPKAML